jgi:hypothetical protein
VPTSKSVEIPNPARPRRAIRNYIFVPNYDPPALEVLLRTAIANPHPDGTYALLVPGVYGPNQAANQALFIVLEPLPAAAGTLDGKPLDLRHYLMNFHDGSHAELYTSQSGDLMQADMTPLHAKYVREHFSLTP